MSSESAPTPATEDWLTVDGQANDCRHDSATGVDAAAMGPGKVWRCDHCGVMWRQGGRGSASWTCDCGLGGAFHLSRCAIFIGPFLPTFATPVPAAVPGEPEAPATNGPPSGWTADGEGCHSPPAAPGWAEGQRAEITWNDDSIVPSPMLATWHGGAWYAGQGDGYALAQGRIAAVTPLSPVPVGYVVINPAETADQILELTGPGQTAGVRAFNTGVQAAAHVIRELAWEKGQAE